MARSTTAMRSANRTRHGAFVWCVACDDTKAPLDGTARPGRRKQKYPRHPLACRLEVLRALKPLPRRVSRDLVVDTVVQPEGGILAGSGFDSHTLRHGSDIAGFLEKHVASPPAERLAGFPGGFSQRPEVGAPDPNPKQLIAFLAAR